VTITVVGGCPGTGKSTLAQTLALQANGIHLETDKFFDFVANKIDPSTKPARKQNEAVLGAWCSAAIAYSESGYDVFVDGVIGPWWFPQLDEKLKNYRYVMLEADLETCVDRVRKRQGQASATETIVKTMHQQFVASDFNGERIDTASKSAEQIASSFLALPARKRK